MTEPDRWGSRKSDAADPNYGRACGLCSAPIRAGERYFHACPPKAPATAPQPATTPKETT